MQVQWYTGKDRPPVHGQAVGAGKRQVQSEAGSVSRVKLEDGAKEGILCVRRRQGVTWQP